MTRIDHLGAAAIIGFVVGVYAPELWRKWRLRRSFVAFRVLDELPPAPRESFPRPFRSADPSPRPRREAS